MRKDNVSFFFNRFNVFIKNNFPPAHRRFLQLACDVPRGAVVAVALREDRAGGVGEAGAVAGVVGEVEAAVGVDALLVAGGRVRLVGQGHVEGAAGALAGDVATDLLNLGGGAGKKKKSDNFVRTTISHMPKKNLNSFLVKHEFMYN